MENKHIQNIIYLIGMFFMAVLMFLLVGCKGIITVRLNNPEGISNDIQVETSRRTLVSIDGTQVTVVTGQVAIDDATVQALGRTVVPIIMPDGQ